MGLGLCLPEPLGTARGASSARSPLEDWPCRLAGEAVARTAILRTTRYEPRIAHVGEVDAEPLIYRTEVLAIIGALAGLVVDVGDIRDSLVEDDEGQGP